MRNMKKQAAVVTLPNLERHTLLLVEDLKTSKEKLIKKSEAELERIIAVICEYEELYKKIERETAETLANMDKQIDALTTSARYYGNGSYADFVTEATRNKLVNLDCTIKISTDLANGLVSDKSNQIEPKKVVNPVIKTTIIEVEGPKTKHDKALKKSIEIAKKEIFADTRVANPEEYIRAERGNAINNQALADRILKYVAQRGVGVYKDELIEFMAKVFPLTTEKWLFQGKPHFKGMIKGLDNLRNNHLLKRYSDVLKYENGYYTYIG